MFPVIVAPSDPREPAGLRVGQRPGFDKLRQQRWNNRESDEAEDFGATDRGDDC
jgi:hypothetical protein